VSPRRLFSEINPRCPCCGVENRFHLAVQEAGRCDNVTPEMTAILDAFAEATYGDRSTGLTMMAQLGEWDDPDDVLGDCPRCGGKDCCYVKAPRACEKCGWEER